MSAILLALSDDFRGVRAIDNEISNGIEVRRSVKLVAKIFTPFILKLGQRRCRDAGDAGRRSSQKRMEVWCTQIKFAFRVDVPGVYGMPDSSGVPTRARNTRTHTHTSASTDRRYALMQAPALLRMLQDWEQPSYLSWSPSNSETLLLPSVLSLPPTLNVVNSRYSLFLFHFFLLHLSSLHHLFGNASYFFPLAYCILISHFFFFYPRAHSAYFSPPKWLRSTRQFSSYRRSLVYSPPLFVFCSCHRSPSSSRMSFDHVNASAT